MGKGIITKAMKKKLKFTTIFFVLILTLLTYSYVLSEDGIYESNVTMDSGTYSVPVEVYDGEVVKIEWPNDKGVTVTGAKINEGEADGIDSDGNSVVIKLKDYHDD
jgi:hypothetical protein